MKKRVNLVIAGLVLAGLAVFLTVEGAEAFCVYNNTDMRVHEQLLVQQTGGHKTGRGFHKYIPAGENECCNWQNKDCNKEGKRDSIVRLDVSYWGHVPDAPDYTYPICHGVEIKAGGWVTVKGEKGNYKCELHNY